MEKQYLTREKIIGKQVIDSKAIVMGTVKDLSFDLVARDFSIIIKAEADKEITVDSKNVKVVGDVILLAVAAETFETPATPPTPEESPSASPPRNTISSHNTGSLLWMRLSKRVQQQILH